MSVVDHLRLYGLWVSAPPLVYGRLQRLDLYLSRRIKGVKKADRKKDVESLISRTGLAPYRNLQAGQLSGGNKVTCS
jgi:ABC-type multidrug transport system ATPase subunit